MSKLIDRIADAVGAEQEGERYHYPEYTKGCWGDPRHKLCHICKFRCIREMLSLFRR